MNQSPTLAVPPSAHPPTSGFLRLAFALAPAAVCALAAALRSGADAGAVLREGGVGLAAGGLFVAGLTLAERFFAGRAARLAGGAVFAALLAVGGAAVGFAGCIPYPRLDRVRDVQAAPAVHPGPPTRPHGKPTPTPSPTPTPPSHLAVRVHAFPWN